MTCQRSDVTVIDGLAMYIEAMNYSYLYIFLSIHRLSFSVFCGEARSEKYVHFCTESVSGAPCEIT